MKRIDGHREFDCVTKPSDLNVQQEGIETALAVAIIKSLVFNNKVQMTAEQLARCERELRARYKTK